MNFSSVQFMNWIESTYLENVHAWNNLKQWDHRLVVYIVLVLIPLSPLIEIFIHNKINTMRNVVKNLTKS